MKPETKDTTNTLLDELYKTRTKDEWDAQLQKIRDYAKNVCPEDKEYWVEWVKGRTDKMKSFKEKYWSKPQYPKKESYIFREDEGKAFINLCNSISNYLKTK